MQKLLKCGLSDMFLGLFKFFKLTELLEIKYHNLKIFSTQPLEFSACVVRNSIVNFAVI